MEQAVCFKIASVQTDRNANFQRDPQLFLVKALDLYYHKVFSNIGWGCPSLVSLLKDTLAHSGMFIGSFAVTLENFSHGNSGFG